MAEIFISLATAGLLLAARRLGRRRTDAAFVVVALFAAFAYTDFFDFHGGGGVFLHAHDAGHYYLGSRYFAELGYTGLYGAMLAAEVESEGHTVARWARDLEGGRLVPARRVLAQGLEIRQSFSAERWRDFRRDADFFRRAMGPLYTNFVLDHGFNTTPLWALGAGALARLVPAGDAAAIHWLLLLDVALVLSMLAAVGLAFGLRTALLATIFFATVHGASFDWVGGAFLRFPWLAALLFGVSLLHRRHYAAAGALLALSAGLRLFPAIFVLGAFVHVVQARLGGETAPRGPTPRGPAPRGPLRLLAAFTATSAALFALTLVSPHHGFEAWWAFAANMGVYLDTVAFNVVGLGTLVASLASKAGWADVAGAVTRLLGLASVALAAFLARRRGDVGALALGCLVLWAALEMAAYYYLVFVLLVIAHRARPRLLALLFALEALTWIAAQVLDVATAVHVVHSLLLALFFGAAHVDDLLDALGLDARPAELPA